jgi:hypothetical protein
MLAKRDPEQKFGDAGWIAYVGEREAALQLIRKSVEENYGGALVAETDPVYANLRGSPEFSQLMNQARQFGRNSWSIGKRWGGSAAFQSRP